MFSLFHDAAIEWIDTKIVELQKVRNGIFKIVPHHSSKTWNFPITFSNPCKTKSEINFPDCELTGFPSLKWCCGLSRKFFWKNFADGKIWGRSFQSCRNSLLHNRLQIRFFVPIRQIFHNEPIFFRLPFSGKKTMLY